jgi:hypothetical protein
MKRAILLSLLALSAHAKTLDVDKIANAIYRAEGGAHTRFPYGVMSVKVSDANQARLVCIATIQNNWKRWQAAGSHGDFIDFLADRYCPPSVDPQGNANWKHNVKFFLK